MIVQSLVTWIDEGICCRWKGLTGRVELKVLLQVRMSEIALLSC